MNMAITKGLRKLRDEAGLTQQELADKIGINRSFISQVERYDKDLTVSLLGRWALACGARLELVREGEELAGLEEEEREVIRALRGLAPERQRLLLDLASCIGRLEPYPFESVRQQVDLARRSCGSEDAEGEGRKTG